ncbi:fimbrial protein [Ewingella americana]|uniref:fimbrial protein n=1 Tax=Ewingella americana TaxID=41202 RepID=UPI001639DF13|nr:fimbrial protein [Ewingella americana]QMV52150.1 type 1 fimbrial protein [Ewingella americana]
MSTWLKNNVLLITASYAILLLAFTVISERRVEAANDCTNTSNCKVQVSFIGEYLEDTCEISINDGSSSESIGLPTLSTSELKNDAAERGSQDFKIALKLCPVNRTVLLKFVSAGSTVPDPATGNLQNEVAVDYSQNVQVRLRKAAGPQMVVGDATSSQEYVIPSTGADVTHYYSAGYYAKGANAVTQGLVRTTAGIELVYQ